MVMVYIGVHRATLYKFCSSTSIVCRVQAILDGDLAGDHLPLFMGDRRLLLAGTTCLSFVHADGAQRPRRNAVERLD